MIALDSMCLLEALLGIFQLQDLLMHKDMAFSSLESPPSPNVYDSICESLCKPWLGIVNVLLNYFIHNGSCHCDVV